MASPQVPHRRVRAALLGLSLGLTGVSPAVAGCQDGDTDAPAAEITGGETAVEDHDVDMEGSSETAATDTPRGLGQPVQEIPQDAADKSLPSATGRTGAPSVDPVATYRQAEATRLFAEARLEPPEIAADLNVSLRDAYELLFASGSLPDDVPTRRTMNQAIADTARALRAANLETEEIDAQTGALDANVPPAATRAIPKSYRKRQATAALPEPAPELVQEVAARLKAGHDPFRIAGDLERGLGVVLIAGNAGAQLDPAVPTPWRSDLPARTTPAAPADDAATAPPVTDPTQVANPAPAPALSPLDLQAARVSGLDRPALGLYAALTASPSALSAEELARSTGLTGEQSQNGLQVLAGNGLARAQPGGYSTTGWPEGVTALEIAVALATQGKLSWGDVARLSGVPRSTTHRELTARGFVPLTNTTPRDEVTARLQRLRELIAEREQAGEDWTITELAETAGLLLKTAAARLTQDGVRSPRAHRPRTESSAERARAIRLAAEDRDKGAYPYLRDAEIAGSLGERASTVSAWLRAAEKAGGLRKRPVPSEEELSAEARRVWDADPRLSAQDVANRLRERYEAINRTRVGAWLEAHPAYVAAQSPKRREALTRKQAEETPSETECE